MSSESTPRATLVPLPPWRGSEKLQKIVRSFENAGLSATSSKPPCRRASTAGTPSIGSPIFPFADTTRRCPPFSLTRKRPSGSGSTAHGAFSPRATTVTSRAASVSMPQARVWAGDAGRCSGALRDSLCKGLQSAAKRGREIRAARTAPVVRARFIGLVSICCQTGSAKAGSKCHAPVFDSGVARRLQTAC